MKYAPQWITKNANYKVDNATFKLPDENGELAVNPTILSDTKVVEKAVAETVSENVQSDVKQEAHILCHHLLAI